MVMLTHGWSQDAEQAPEESPAGATATTTQSAEFFFDFLEYRYDLHGRVLDRWQNLVRANRGALAPGTTTLKYYVNEEGFISVIEKKAGSGPSNPEAENARKLGSYALALENKEPTAFPETVKAVYPKGFFYQITFVVR